MHPSATLITLSESEGAGVLSEGAGVLVAGIENRLGALVGVLFELSGLLLQSPTLTQEFIQSVCAVKSQLDEKKGVLQYCVKHPPKHSYTP